MIDGDNGRECKCNDNNGRLNPGYLGPLFLYAIECMDREENERAVGKISQIRNQIYRSQFFGTFGKALSGAQLRKERRVTSSISVSGPLGLRLRSCSLL